MSRQTALGYAALVVALAVVWVIDIYAIPWTNPYYANIA